MSIRARVPVAIRPDIKTEFVSFDFEDNKTENVAVLFPGWEKAEHTLVRIHSECLTGDVFASKRCDCGDQLHEAIDRMAIEGGILIYLRQEGRGIGLYNKLDAYKVQMESGKDTFEANLHLGFPADSRDYKIVVRMLKALDVSSIRLLTNNPDKVAAVSECGIEVVESIPTGFFPTEDNLSYLKAKKKHGHSIINPAKEECA